MTPLMLCDWYYTVMSVRGTGPEAGKHKMIP